MPAKQNKFHTPSPPLGEDVISEEDVEVSKIDAELSDQIDDPVGEVEESHPPEEITGRASSTNENLDALFENKSDEHLEDGYRGSSGEDDELDPPDEEPESIR